MLHKVYRKHSLLADYLVYLCEQSVYERRRKGMCHVVHAVEVSKKVDP